MKLSKQAIIEILRQVEVEVRKKFRAKIKGFFGSYARGDEKASSDIDVLVEFEAGADLIDFVGLCDFLEEKLNRKVDVVPIRSVREEIKVNVLREAIYL